MWGIYLFVSWTNYSQPECNGSTILILFMAPFTTRKINSVDRDGIHFFLWPLWLLFCLGVTLTLTIILATSSSYRSTWLSSGVSRSGGTGTRMPPTTPTIISWARIAHEMFPSWADKRGQFVFWCNIVTLCLWIMFVAGEQLERRNLWCCRR